MDIKLENSWKNLLKEEFERPYFKELVAFVRNEYATKKNCIFPQGHQIFRALDLCTVEKVKVVILGQDPYPTRGHAHGLCFSVEEQVRPFPKSLINIFKEIQSDLGQPFPPNGSLVRWADQGVLLLNAVLTVEEGKPESHARKGWEMFTDAVISKLNENRSGIVYMLWGSKAQEKAAVVDGNRNLILRSVHPSPLSAHRGFLGCRHFSQANEYLVKNGQPPIIW
jgi:uracil-DNA glycosylase